MKKITIFTPTYNRCELLKILYNSLVQQSEKNFEWLIIDDGSTDDTEYTVKYMILENKIKIKYFKQENGGKQMAYNKAIDICESELFICVDSDDELKFDAIEYFISQWKEKKGKEENLWAIIGPKQCRNTNEINWTNYSLKCKFNYLYENLKYKGETYIIMNSKLAKKVNFEKFNNEKFIPENYIYDELDSIADVKFCDEAKYLFEYQIDGYTKSNVNFMLNNINGFMNSNKKRASYKHISKKVRIFSCARYYAMKFLNKNRIEEEYEICPLIVVLGLILSPIFVINYNLKKIKYKGE